MKANRFNIRVYGLCICEEQVLLSHERYGNFEFTKFPGGGLEFGEGTIDCLKREFMEELDMEIDSVEHFYTTDFYQASVFRDTDQIISIYYLVKPKEDQHIWNQDKSQDKKLISIFWKNIQELDSSALTFPIDKHVWKLFKQAYTEQ